MSIEYQFIDQNNKLKGNTRQVVTAINRDGTPIGGGTNSVSLLAPYEISRDDQVSVANVQYFGFINNDGAWYIQEIDCTDASDGTYKYINGATGFLANWANRTSLSYVDFDDLTF